MENIIPIKGKTQYSITLDPGVWIFDDRRIDLTTYFDTAQNQIDELEAYTKSISKHWDREIMEGAIYPPTLSSEKKFEKEKLLTGSFAVPFKPFLKNATPLDDARNVIIEQEGNDISIPLEKAYDLILGFSKDGKPLKEDGPIYVYFGDGSNRNEPINNVKAFRVE